MPLEIVTVPCLSDNYAYLLRDAATGTVGLVDAPEAAAIEAALEGDRAGRSTSSSSPTTTATTSTGWRRSARRTGRRWRARRRIAGGCRRSTSRSAKATPWRSARASRRCSTCPGHTVGHIAYYFAEAGALFSADSLMVMGCGRLFEGTPEQMWESLVEDGGAAGRDAGVFRPRVRGEQRPLRAVGRRRQCGAARRVRRKSPRCGRWCGATVPARLDLERATNPFLRVTDAGLQGPAGAGEIARCPSFRRGPPPQGCFLSSRGNDRSRPEIITAIFLRFGRRAAHTRP